MFGSVNFTPLHIPRRFAKPHRLLSKPGRKLICVSVIYAKETTGVFAFYGTVFVPRKAFCPTRLLIKPDAFGVVRRRREVKERQIDSHHQKSPESELPSLFSTTF